jgi:hypothetical protein
MNAMALYWLFLRWFVANLASNGQPLGLSFSGSFWAFLGWAILAVVSIITIIGWAWVVTAWLRWICRHIDGSRRDIVFEASGWQVLWRTVVFCLIAAFIIPIPWALGWYTRWYVTQFALVERATQVDTASPAFAD